MTAKAYLAVAVATLTVSAFAGAAEEGGILTRRHDERVIRFVNAQRTIPAQQLTNFALRIERSCIAAPVEIGDATVLAGRDPLALVKSVKRIRRTAAVVAFVEAKDFPTMLIAPEDAWGILNVRALKADNPSKAVLAARIEKELWRVFGATMGGTKSQMGPCLMGRVVHNLAQLDALTAKQLGPDATLRVMEEVGALGIECIERTTYREACQDGWAPAPTNAVQKAIWEKVHSEKERGPANAIKIDPPKAKK